MSATSPAGCQDRETRTPGEAGSIVSEHRRWAWHIPVPGLNLQSATKRLKRRVSLIFSFRWRFNENVHLLSHIERHVRIGKPVDRLKDASIDTLGAVSRQRLLRNNVRFKTDELEPCAVGAVTAFRSFSRTSRPHPPRVVFVDVGANMKFADITHDQQRFCQLSSR